MNIWGRLGISIAIVAVFCIVMTEFLQSTAYYETWKWQICVGFIAASMVLLVVGRILNARWRRANAAAAARSKKQQDGEEDATPEAPFLLLDLSYWGVMFLLFGIVIIFITPQPKPIVGVLQAAPVKAAARQKPTNAPPPTPVSPSPEKLRVFPRVVLQGITYRTTDSSVLINGKTLFVGDRIGEAKVVAITRTAVTLEFDGQFKVLLLGQ